ncbi:hypothetical protein ACFFX0_24080 [Citricoccus parietis]|uniref:Uncharacterized protein n=1 Tax=Citricoccus parietis TaxID=592307 RepID=A0ABV5G5C1_9MICC
MATAPRRRWWTQTAAGAPGVAGVPRQSSCPIRASLNQSEGAASYRSARPHMYARPIVSSGGCPRQWSSERTG